MPAQKAIPLLRDLVCLGLGSFGFVWQTTHKPDAILMIGCIATLCGPAVMAAWALRGSTPDSGSSSPSPGPPPSPPPPSPLPSSAGAGES